MLSGCGGVCRYITIITIKESIFQVLNNWILQNPILENWDALVIRMKRIVACWMLYNKRQNIDSVTKQYVIVKVFVLLQQHSLMIQYIDETNFYTSVLPVDGKSSQS